MRARSRKSGEVDVDHEDIAAPAATRPRLPKRQRPAQRTQLRRKLASKLHRSIQMHSQAPTAPTQTSAHPPRLCRCPRRCHEHLDQRSQIRRSRSSSSRSNRAHGSWHRGTGLLTIRESCDGNSASHNCKVVLGLLHPCLLLRRWHKLLRRWHTLLRRSPQLLLTPHTVWPRSRKLRQQRLCPRPHRKPCTLPLTKCLSTTRAREHRARQPKWSRPGPKKAPLTQARTRTIETLAGGVSGRSRTLTIARMRSRKPRRSLNCQSDSFATGSPGNDSLGSVCSTTAN